MTQQSPSRADGISSVHLTNRLRLWRVDHGLSERELAGLTGISPAMLSRVERGERQLAPLTRIKVARRLGVAVEELFEPEAIEESAA